MNEAKPALTPEEWAEGVVHAGDEAREAYCTLKRVGGRLYAAAGDGRDYYGQGDGLVARPVALAALCLHGYFTHEDVELHRLEAERCRGIASPHARWHDSMADRLENLLPPREP